MATQWPLIITGLVTTVLPSLDGWEPVTLFDGPLTLPTPPKTFATIGHLLGQEAAGSFSSVQHPNGAQRVETGEIHSQLTVWTGSKNVAGMRAVVFPYLDALDAFIRDGINGRTLGGLLSADGVSSYSVDPLTQLNPAGTAATVNFTISYQTST